ncbi:DUF7619 domain-containing protein [Aureispira anguillae]|uniref:SBBP repeat-containing protein n=1 Tax=Aureispira anguillae TaxID=2864201 RepID=A0A916DVP5_9BACT|nr:SBBP repeat-containing protein [Aureispira anguillae]BDS13316.1 SBBP repeat-containing protein [Aureispira anguillae]
MNQKRFLIELTFYGLLLLFLPFHLTAQDVSLDWAKSTGSTSLELGNTGTIDKAGNVYTAGVFSGVLDADPGAGTHYLTSNGGRDIFIQKLNAAGELIWAVSIGGASSADSPYGIATDALGNVYVTGQFSGAVDFDPSPNTALLVNSSDLFVLKLDAQGNYLWAKTIQGNSGPYSQGRSLTVDHNGDVCITGLFGGSPDFDPGAGVHILYSANSSSAFILKLDANGNFIWAKSIDGYSAGLGITHGPTNEVCVTGWFLGAADFDSGTGVYPDTSWSSKGLFVLKLDANGNVVWAKSASSTGDDQGHAITVDQSGNVLTTGAFRGGADFDPGTGVYNLPYSGSYMDIFIQKLDPNGNFLWAAAMGGGNEDRAYGIITDESENVYTVGGTMTDIDYDPSAGTYILDKGVFVQKLAPNGNFLWAVTMGDEPSAIGRSIALDEQNNIYVSGDFRIARDYDPNSGTTILPVVGSNDAFVFKLRQKGVYGRVYPDYNQNCLQDNNEDGIPSRRLLVQPGNIVVTSNASGIWAIDSLPTGSYTITIDTSNGWNSTCPIVQNFSIINPNALTQGPSFGLQTSTPCPIPHVSIHAPVLRPGFSNQRVYIEASNLPLSFETIYNAYVVVELDTLLSPQTASLPFISLGGNRYRIDLDSIASGYSKRFWIDCYLSPSAVLGQSLCMKAQLYPVGTCALDTQIQPYPTGFTACNTAYDQSNLAIHATCDNDTIKFRVVNTGVGNMTCYAPVKLWIDGQYILMDSVQLQSGDTTVFSYLGDGRTWRMETFQHPLQPGLSSPSATIERCGYNGNWTANLVTIFPQDDADAHIDIFCGLVSGSYDPNDKTGFPLGVGATHSILPNQKIEYLLRFQNTGTDTAFTVVIRDTLSLELDLFSVRTETASHAYQFRMYGPRVIEWTFQHIMLPDSNVNEAESHGFVRFSVQQNPNLPIGTLIQNDAAIYFDYNNPIITNTYFHTIDTAQTLNWDGQDTIGVTVCGGTTINGIYYTNSGTYVQAVHNNGLDSLYHYVVTVEDSYSTLTVSTCDSFVLNGQTFTETGIYEQRLTNAIGCDSVLTLYLTINASQATLYPAVCSSYTAADGQVYTTSGNYTAIIPNSNGCDSIITINLTIQNSLDTITVVECDSFVAPDGQVLTTTGQYTAVIPNSYGCDSIITIDLVIGKNGAAIHEAACESYTAPDGQIYTSSGTYTATVTNSYGCDSLITIHLTVHHNTTDSIGVVWCDNYVAADGQVYTSSGIYTAVIPNYAGCDSTLTINLTLTPLTINTNVNVLGTTLASFATGVDFQWLDCNNGYAPIVGATFSTYTPAANGNYALQLTQMGCSDTSACYPIVVMNDQRIAKENDWNVVVYPNPVHSTLIIENLIQQELSIELVDNLGRTLVSKTGAKQQLKMDMGNLSQGLYYLSINNGSKTMVQKVIKE